MSVKWPREKELLELLHRAGKRVTKGLMEEAAEMVLEDSKEYYKHAAIILDRSVRKAKEHNRCNVLFVVSGVLRKAKSTHGSKDRLVKRMEPMMPHIFASLAGCPAEQIEKVHRVLQSWEKENLYAKDVTEELGRICDGKSTPAPRADGKGGKDGNASETPPSTPVPPPPPLLPNTALPHSSEPRRWATRANAHINGANRRKDAKQEPANAGRMALDTGSGSATTSAADRSTLPGHSKGTGRDNSALPPPPPPPMRPLSFSLPTPPPPPPPDSSAVQTKPKADQLTSSSASTAQTSSGKRKRTSKWEQSAAEAEPRDAAGVSDTSAATAAADKPQQPRKRGGMAIVWSKGPSVANTGNKTELKNGPASTNESRLASPPPPPPPAMQAARSSRSPKGAARKVMYDPFGDC